MLKLKLILLAVCCCSGILFGAGFFSDPAQLSKQSVSNELSVPVKLAGGSVGGQDLSSIPIRADENYILGPGDQIGIHVIIGDNALNLDYNFQLNPDGRLFFPNLGELNFSGQTLKQAKGMLMGLIRKKYSESITVSVLLIMPRTISVYVVGQAANPGLHSVYATSRLTQVLKEAGGVLPGGSERQVLVKRALEVIKVDLYEINTLGKLDKDIEIRSGDVIEIPMAMSKVTIVGGVNRPGNYEIIDGEQLSDLLLHAGNIINNASLTEVIFLKREIGEDKYENIKLNLHNLLVKGDQSQNMVLKTGDIINVPVIEEYVYVQGDVSKTGRQNYDPGKKMSDYLNLAGGPLAKADLSGVTVVRSNRDKSKVINVNAYNILRLGNKNEDIEILAGDVINVPGNFFYVNDFASFSSIIMTAVGLYNVLVR